jgi:hypothetical protein
MYNRVAFPSPLPAATDLDLFFEWDITFNGTGRYTVFREARRAGRPL